MIILVLNNKVNVESIKNSIEAFNWEVIFINKGIHKQVSIFNETLMNIFSNFTPNRHVTFDDRDPPRMNGNDYFELQGGCKFRVSSSI